MRSLSGALYHLNRVVLGEPSRLVFGNDAHLRHNVGARSDLRRLRRSSTGLGAGTSTAACRRLHRQGFLQVAPPLPGPLVATIVRGLDTNLDDPKLCRPMGSRRPSTVRYLTDPLAHVPCAADFLAPSIRRLVEEYYGTPFRVLHVRSWRIESLRWWEQGVDHYGNLWHCDDHPVTTLKLFVQVSEEVGEGGGAFRLHDAPDTRRIMRLGFVRPGLMTPAARRAADDPAGIVELDGPPGSALLCSTPRCLHRAGVPRPGRSRSMLQFTFAPAATPLPEDWAARLPPDRSVVGA